MPISNYVTLGRSGLRVSPCCLGTMTFGEDWGWGAGVDECEKMMNRYFELGGNFVDTANGYTFGHSEKIVGDYFQKNKSRRERTVLATKFFTNMTIGDPNGGGTNRKTIVHSCEESLRRLQTDYIDLYWMHAWDQNTPVQETMRALDDLVRAGKIRYIGFSDTPAWVATEAQMMAQFRGWTPLAALQLEYNLLERTIEGEHIPMAREMGLGITPWSPLKSGLLSGKYTRQNRNTVKPGRGAWVADSLNDHTFDVLDEVVKVAREIDSTPARVSLKWVMSQKGVSSTILGARTLQQLEDNLAAIDIKISPEQLERLSAVTKPKLNFPADFVENVKAVSSPGMTINGYTAAPSPLAPPSQEGYY